MAEIVSDESAFFAFASKPDAIVDQIIGAIRRYRESSGQCDILPWTELDISGALIWQQILREIDRRQILIADVSVLNPNVTYEIGYAIGRAKKLRFVLNSDMIENKERSRIGIFDALGYFAYNSADTLFSFLQTSLESTDAIYIDQGFDKEAPIFFFDAFEKSDLINHIKTCIKKRLVRFRSFDPQEKARLPVHEAVREVSLSEGVVVSMVPATYPHAELHNLRAAFVAGLAHGMDKQLSIIQLGEAAAPLDFREFTDNSYSKGHVENAIDRFALAVTPRLQARVRVSHDPHRSILEQIDLGGSVAENELQIIDEYYLDTDAYLRANRGEVRLITGRKGSGKTALFIRLRNQKRRRRSNIVVDLKPEGYKLLKFKERIVDVLSSGSLNHVVSAIWEYVVLLEIAYKALENDRSLYARDRRITDEYLALKDLYEQDEYYSEGDFSERVAVLLDEIGQKIEGELAGGKEVILNAKHVSEIIYKHPINELRSAVTNYLALRGETWVLIDNLDKGWPSAGVTKNDVVLIVCLIEALEKINRSFRQRSFDCFYSVVFLRGDVYENLVDTSSDRGKITPVSVDWSDTSALRELLRKRFVYSDFDPNLALETIWQEIAVPEIEGRNSLDLVIERSLFRPRALVELVYACKSLAVNRRHSKIMEDDFREACRLFSISLIDNVSLEMRDIAPCYENILYEFIDKEPTFSRATLVKQLKRYIRDNIAESSDGLIDMLLWFGFLGVRSQGEITTYIFDVGYNMHMMRSLSRVRGSASHFVVHPAFRSGLSISEPRVNPQIRLL